MRVLLDTNVVSELRREQADDNVINWMSQQSLELCYLSVLSLGEIEKGIAYLGQNKRATAYKQWLEQDLKPSFVGRILTIDEDIMTVWGELVGTLLKQGRPLPLIDSFFAATAVTYDLTLATRITKDVEALPVAVVNPWLSVS